jgi:23S rRNA-/tRNA-specific pseudouridylate synthase
MPASVVRFVVPAEARHQRLDHFLAAQLPELSRARLQQLIRAAPVSACAAVRRSS